MHRLMNVNLAILYSVYYESYKISCVNLAILLNNCELSGNRRSEKHNLLNDPNNNLPRTY
jgi:hypothetical protein